MKVTLENVTTILHGQTVVVPQLIFEAESVEALVTITTDQYDNPLDAPRELYVWAHGSGALVEDHTDTTDGAGVDFSMRSSEVDDEHCLRGELFVQSEDEGGCNQVGELTLHQSSAFVTYDPKRFGADQSGY